MLRFLILSVIIVGACAAPVPPTSVPSASPQPSRGALEPIDDPASVAQSVGLLPEQLVAIEEGFVAARFDESDRLGLVWIRPADEGYEVVLMASVDESRAQGSISTNTAVCPDGVGLTRVRFVFGQASSSRALSLSGPSAVGGTVTDGVYVFALDPSEPEAAARWAIDDETGRRVATSDPAWFTGTPPPPAGDELCSITSATH